MLPAARAVIIAAVIIAAVISGVEVVAILERVQNVEGQKEPDERRDDVTADGELAVAAREIGRLEHPHRRVEAADRRAEEVA